jgi:lipopolysaccharide export system protein LptA
MWTCAISWSRTMSKQCFRNSLFFAASLLLMAATFPNVRPGKNTGEPIVITSNNMHAEKLGDKVTFTEKVTLKNEGMTLTSDVMIVYYNAGSKDIREVEAHGNVVVRKDGRVALANNALYSPGEGGMIVLTGDASIVETENKIGGEKITLFMADDRSIIEGRGKVMFYKDKSVEGRKSK